MISFGLDARPVIEQLNEAGMRQVPFAISKALNTLANEAQADERKHMQGRFTLRRQSWNLQSIKIDKADRASKTNWKVIIRVDERASHLDKFEEEGIHEPFGDRRYLWIPNNREVFRNRIIQAVDPLHPKNLRLGILSGPRRSGELGDRAVRGLQQTFMIKTQKGPIVLQRLGTGQGSFFTDSSINRLSLDSWGKKGARGRLVKDKKAGTQVLFQLRERVSVPLKLEFVNTVGKAVQQKGQAIFRQTLAEALSTARNAGMARERISL